MTPIFKKSGLGLAMAMAIATAAIFAGASGIANAKEVPLTLAGDQEVPAVTTEAKGSGTLNINDDKTVSGSVTTKGVKGTMAHIHQGAAGKNGPVIVPLEKKGDDGWAVPAGAKLTDAQYKSFKDGDLYVNVHSAAHPGGEIRAQLKP
jgi:hypothetical protein